MYEGSGGSLVAKEEDADIHYAAASHFTVPKIDLVKIPRISTKLYTQSAGDVDQKLPKINSFRQNTPQSIMVLIKACLLAAACGVSLFQTVEFMNIFINQPMVANIVPVHNLSLTRPDLIVCVNVYKTALFIIHKQVDVEMLSVLSLLSSDLSPLLFENSLDIYNVDTDDYPYTVVEDILYRTGLNFTECESILGFCNSVNDGFARRAGENCCDSVTKLTPQKGICYRVNSSHVQNNAGKINAAIYELRFPDTHVNLIYDIYLAAGNEPVSTLQQPITSIKPNLEVNIEVQMLVKSRLKTTSKCTNQFDLVHPLCRRKVMSEVIRILCGCEDEIPVWLFNASQHQEKFMNGTARSLRPCRFMESLQCIFKSVARMSRMMNKTVSRCFDYSCRSFDFPDKTVSTTLAPYFRRHTNHSNEESKQFSVVYVFYGSMTITQEYEVRAHTVLSILSDLGGIWGLWLGWSLYQVAEVSLATMARLAHKYSTS